jgi:hypothetical protein
MKLVRERRETADETKDQCRSIQSLHRQIRMLTETSRPSRGERTRVERRERRSFRSPFQQRVEEGSGARSGRGNSLPRRRQRSVSSRCAASLFHHESQKTLCKLLAVVWLHARRSASIDEPLPPLGALWMNLEDSSTVAQGEGPVERTQSSALFKISTRAEESERRSSPGPLKRKSSNDGGNFVSIVVLACEFLNIELCCTVQYSCRILLGKIESQGMLTVI